MVQICVFGTPSNIHHKKYTTTLDSADILFNVLDAMKNIAGEKVLCWQRTERRKREKKKKKEKEERRRKKKKKKEEIGRKLFNDDELLYTMVPDILSGWIWTKVE